MSNSTNDVYSASEDLKTQYCFRSNPYYGRTKVGINRDDKTYYAIEAGGEIISPWFDELTLWPSFNVCKLKGVYFLTSASGKEIISDMYRKMWKFQAINGLGRYFAKVEGLNKKLGTLDSNGKVGIKCDQDVLERVGSAHAVCGKMFEDGMRYGMFAVNGEKTADYMFVKYAIVKGKVVFIKEDGEKYYYSKSGARLKC